MSRSHQAIDAGSMLACRHAAAMAHPDTLHEIAGMHARGEGVPVDPPLAESLYLEAALHGSQRSRLELSGMASRGDVRGASDAFALGWIIDCPRTGDRSFDDEMNAAREALLGRLDRHGIEMAWAIATAIRQAFADTLAEMAH